MGLHCWLFSFFGVRFCLFYYFFIYQWITWIFFNYLSFYIFWLGNIYNFNLYWIGRWKHSFCIFLLLWFCFFTSDLWLYLVGLFNHTVTLFIHFINFNMHLWGTKGFSSRRGEAENGDVHWGATLHVMIVYLNSKRAFGQINHTLL